MKKILATVIVSLLIISANSQTADKKWGVGLSPGVYGNIDNSGIGFMPQLYLSRYLSPSFDLILNQEFGYFNSETTSDLDLANVFLNLRFKLLKNNTKFQPYLFAGPGYLQDNADKGINFDAGIGAKFPLKPSVALFVEGGYINGIDVVVKGVDYKDDFWKLSAGIEFSFGKIKDADGDGVSDRKDEEDDTPAGVEVDEDGRALDSDGDGTPDYRDDCPDLAGPAELDGCPDKDGDGVPDKDDKCPDTPGVIELNGCPDKDGDGVADADDDCPDTPGLKKFNGCPDTDGDGVIDSIDKCPDTPAGCPVSSDGCPLDSDNDGVIDCEDECPNVAGVAENNGCPPKLEEITFGPIYFDFDKATLRPDAKKIIDDAVDQLNLDVPYNIELDGYTCDIGTDNYNQSLSVRRAKSVVAYMVKKGVSGEAVAAIGYGEENPAVENTYSKRKLNRRVEVKVTIRRVR